MGSAWQTREGTKSPGRATAVAPLKPLAPVKNLETSSPPPGDPSETTFILKSNFVSRTLISRFPWSSLSSFLTRDPLDIGPELHFVGNWELCRVLQDSRPDRRQGGWGGGGRGGHGRRPENGRDHSLYQVLNETLTFWICHWGFKGLGKSVEY